MDIQSLHCIKKIRNLIEKRQTYLFKGTFFILVFFWLRHFCHFFAEVTKKFQSFCLTVVSKLTITVVISLSFQIF